MKLDIHGRVYDLKFVPCTHPDMKIDGDLLWGRAMYSKSTILVDKNISSEKKKETALHEVLHTLDPDMEEVKDGAFFTLPLKATASTSGDVVQIVL